MGKVYPALVLQPFWQEPGWPRVGGRALVRVGRAGGGLGNVEVMVCLGSKILEVNEA